MSSNLNGVHGLRGTPITPPSPARAVGTSRAVVRVTPAAPGQGVDTGQPLSRSGLSLEALLGADDLLEARPEVRQGATAMGLSQARTALLRQLPGDALAALDDVWSGAQRSEEGWYLRAGALTVLGLPGEGDRVATEGLAQRPASLALRYLQSVARSVNGDWQGARAALAEALDAAPADPVLRLQQAVVLGRQGHLADASEIIAEVQQQGIEHPAVDWARGIVRGLTADRARGEARQTMRMASGEFAVIDADDLNGSAGTAATGGVREAQPGVRPDMQDAVQDVLADDTVRWSPADGGDLVEHAFASLGARIVQRGDGLPANDMRVLMRALSAGGTLMGSCTPDQAHAARTLLGQLLESIRQLEASTVIRPTPSVGLAALLAALRRDDHAEAGRLWRRSSIAVPPGARRLMQALLDGARMVRETSTSGAFDATGATDATRDRDAEMRRRFRQDGISFASIVRNERDDGVLLPVRFGLSLLREAADSVVGEHGGDHRGGYRDESVASAAAMHGRVGTPPMSLEGLAGGRMTPVSVTGTDLSAAVVRGEATGMGWGAARAANALTGESQRVGDVEGSGVRIVAVLCVALAVGASMLGFNAVAIALAAGAVWLGMRRSTKATRRY